MVLTDEGAVLSFGDVRWGQLGHGDGDEDQLEPKEIEALRDVRCVAISAGRRPGSPTNSSCAACAPPKAESAHEYIRKSTKYIRFRKPIVWPSQKQ